MYWQEYRFSPATPVFRRFDVWYALVAACAVNEATGRLTQAKMAELFEVQKAAISKHLKNIFKFSFNSMKKISSITKAR